MKISLTTIFLMIFTFALAANVFSQARSGGAISGKLLKSNGKPLAYTELELVPVDSNKIVIDYRLIATSYANGSFFFTNLPDGKYTLSINFDDKPTDLSPYQTFFYPNTPKRSEAEVLEVRDRNKFANLIFRLPPPLAQKKITGNAVFTNGKPVTGAFIAMLDVEFDESIPYGIAKTDKNGNFSVTVFEGRTYRFGAILFEKEAKTVYESISPVIAAGESQVFTIDATTPVVKIVLKTSEDLNRIKERYLGMNGFKNRETL